MKVHVVHLVSSELIEYSTSLLLWLRRELRPWEVEEKGLEDTDSGWSSSEESAVIYKCLPLFMSWCEVYHPSVCCVLLMVLLLCNKVRKILVFYPVSVHLLHPTWLICSIRVCILVALDSQLHSSFALNVNLDLAAKSTLFPSPPPIFLGWTSFQALSISVHKQTWGLLYLQKESVDFYFF